jgi:aspartate aminotransferase-like enzyme
MTIRIGIMGYNARPEVVETLLTALSDALQLVRQESGGAAVSETQLISSTDPISK